MLQIIDTHQHLWDRSQFDLPWIAGAEPLNKDFLMSDYLEATRDLGVVRTIYMEVNVDPGQRLAEAEYVAQLCQAQDNPMRGAVISGSPGADDFEDYIGRFEDSPYIKGVRQVLHGPDTPKGTCLEAPFVSGVRLLGELGMSFDICLRPAELGDGVQLVDQCPGTRFIVDHCGNADPLVVSGAREADPGDAYAHQREQWMQDMQELGQRDNTFCKISGIVARVPSEWTPQDLAPTIDHCLDAFGPDRVIFGGDWPVCTLGATYREWAGALREVISSRSEADQRKLLHDNAVEIFGLD